MIKGTLAALLAALLLAACPGPETGAPTTATAPAADPETDETSDEWGDEWVATEEPAEPTPPTPPTAPTPPTPPTSPTPPTPPTKPTAGGEPAGVMNGLVAAHNEVRALHCAAPITWSAEVAAVAQQWADHLRDSGCKFDHRPRNKYGENLFSIGPAGRGNAKLVTRDWYSEVRDYDYSNPGFAMNTGHFTQVVWGATQRLGCGVAVCNNSEIWVCNYDPPGNSGGYREQVLSTGCKR